MMHKLLAERNYPVDKIHYFVSKRSASKVLPWGDREVVVKDITKADFHGIDVALFSTGDGTSKQRAPEIARADTTVIDSSSTWRMGPRVPLIVSQVNSEDIGKTELGVIANPNCITMAAVPVMKPLRDAAGLEAIQITTFQAASGSGISGVRTLAEQIRQTDDPQVLTHDGSVLAPFDLGPYIKPIAFNALSQAGSFVDDGEGGTDGKKRLRNESHEIPHISGLLMTGTCVRVPVFTGHSLSIHARFSRPIIPGETRPLLTNAPGTGLSRIPTPLEVAGRGPSCVGRIRQDQSVKDGIGLVLFVSNDNLRRGAALNAIQITELLAR